MLGCTKELGKKWGKAVAARREECLRLVNILGMHAVNGNCRYSSSHNQVIIS